MSDGDRERIAPAPQTPARPPAAPPGAVSRGGCRAAMRYGIFGLLLAVPLLYQPHVPDLKSVVTEGVTVGLLALFLAWGHPSGWAGIGRVTLLAPLVALLAASIASLAPAVDTFEGLRGAYRLAMAILLLLILSAVIQEREDGEVVALVLGGVGALVGLIGILQVLSPAAALPAGTGGRAIGTLGNSNYLGGYLATLLPVALGAACLADRRGVRFVHAAFAAPMLVAIALTKARGAWFGLGVGTVALLVRSSRRRSGERRTGGWVTPIALLAGPILAFALAEAIVRPFGLSVLERVPSPAAFRDRGAQDRVEWWAQGGRLAMAHPLLGVGISNFPAAIVPYLRHVEAALNAAFWVEHPHNELLSVTIEVGALGLGAALWLILRVGRLVWRAFRSEQRGDFLLPAVAAGLMGAAGDSLFFYLFHDPTGLLVVLALLVILERSVAPRAGSAAGRCPWLPRPAAAAAWVICAGLFVWLGLRPAVSTWLVNRAREARRLQDTALAVELLRSAVGWNGRSVVAHYELGSALLHSGRPQEAAAALRAALHLNPLFISARNNLAYARVVLTRPDEARQTYRELIALVPHYAAAHNNLGYLDLQAGDFQAARAHLRRALALFPGQSDARYNLGRIALAEGDHREAIHQLEEALRLAPGATHAWIELARARVAAGTLEPALTALARAISLDPGLRYEAMEDRRLAPLRGSPAFEELVGPRRPRPAASPSMHRGPPPPTASSPLGHR